MVPFFLWSRDHYRERGVITSMVQEELKDIYEDNAIYNIINRRINLRIDLGVGDL